MKGPRNAAVSIGLLVGAAFSLLAGEGQWTSEGPAHVAVYSLGLGKSPGTFYASTPDGVFRSTEPGVWTSILSGGSGPNILAVDPSDAATLYVAASGLFKSTDGGDHFQILSGLSLGVVQAIAIDPIHSSTLYVGGDLFYPGGENGTGPAEGGAIYKSIDGGTNWTALDTTLLVDTIASLVIDPHRDDYVYAGADLYLSSSYPDYPDQPAPRGQNNAIIGTQNAGANWRQLSAGTEEASINGVNALAADPQSGVIYAGTSGFLDGAVLTSSDSGATWTSSSIGLGLHVFGINALVVDPTSPRTIYAGTSGSGVFRSLDGGSSWTPMSDGLEKDETYQVRAGLWVHSLSFNPVDGVLRAGTDNGVYAIRPNVPSPPCSPAAEYLCLLGGRYRVSVMAQNPASYVVERGVAVQNGDRFGSFSLPAFTGDPLFPEVVVKMIAPPADRGAWVFHGSLTNLPYVLSVTDTTTGRIETYTNDPQNRLCGGADTAAFFGDSPVPGAEALPESSLAKAESRVSRGTGALSLLGNRFSVTLSASGAGGGRTEAGVAVAMTDRYGYFSLPGFTGDPTFPEVFVKMVDARTMTGKFWFFYTGLTSLNYTLTVKDSATGTVRTYQSMTQFCGAADTEAFTDSPSGSSGPDLNGLWSGTISFPSDCFTCRSSEEIQVTLSRVGDAVTGHFSTQCLGNRELSGTLNGDLLTLDFSPISGTGNFTGLVSSTRIHVERNCDPWGYGNDHTMELDLSR